MEMPMTFHEIERVRGNFAEANREVLIQILTDNAGTEYGRRYGFHEIGSYDEFRRRLPLTTYSDYEDAVGRIMEGEAGLLTSYELYGMVKTSGSTEESKYLPVTQEALRRYDNVIDRYAQSVAGCSGGKRLLVSFIRTDLGKKRNPLDVSLISAVCYRYMYEYGRIDFSCIAGEEGLNFFPEECDYLYTKLWLAFATPELVTLEAFFLYDILIFFQYMEDHFEEVLAAMRSRRIPDSVRLPDGTKERLVSMAVNRMRLDDIERECRSGFTGIAKRLWRELRVVSGIGSSAFEVEERSLKKYTGDLSMWYYICGASECVMGVAARPDSYAYLLLPDNAFYEFWPVGKGEAAICDASGLRTGGEYELVLTTCSGLYRYQIGDVIRIVGFYGTVPVFQFRYRKNLVLNIAGEKYNIARLDHAVKRWDEACGIRVWQYYFYEDYSVMPACYHGVVGVDRADADAIDRGRTAEVLDGILKSLSRDYEELRRLDCIRRVRLDFVDKDSFLALDSANQVPEGQAKGHSIRRNEAGVIEERKADSKRTINQENEGRSD